MCYCCLNGLIYQPWSSTNFKDFNMESSLWLLFLTSGSISRKWGTFLGLLLNFWFSESTRVKTDYLSNAFKITRNHWGGGLWGKVGKYFISPPLLQDEQYKDQRENLFKIYYSYSSPQGISEFTEGLLWNRHQCSCGQRIMSHFWAVSPPVNQGALMIFCCSFKFFILFYLVRQFVCTTENIKSQQKNKQISLH